MTSREYLRASDIAQLTGVSLRTVRRWIAEEYLVSTKVGGTRLVAKSELDRALSPSRKSGGGNCYGYDVVRGPNNASELERGGRCINEKEAAIVSYIFNEYAAGKSPKAIAHALNQRNVPGPAGKAWGPSTINGNWRRGTGILNNEIYVGRLVWNRLTYVKNPNTGKRVSRLNKESDLIITDVPELRIIDEDLWERVKERQRCLRKLPSFHDNSAHASCYPTC